MTIPYATSGVSGVDVGAAPPSLLADLIALTKPRITLMNVVPMLGGAWLAVNHGVVRSTPLNVAVAVVGTVLVVASANTLNMYLERGTDGLMDRTKNRPLPTGRISPRLALWFGVGLGALAEAVLAIGVNLVTALLALLALVSYVCIYTPLKRRTSHALLVGAVPGAMPPLLGWSAVTGEIQAPAVLLFGVMFLWQVPHFLAIATFRRDDYARAGMKVLPVERGDRVTRWNIVAYLVLLLATSFGLAATGVGGRLYLVAAAVLGAVFFGSGLWGLRPSAGNRWARGLFAVSIGYLVLLFSALMLSP